MTDADVFRRLRRPIVQAPMFGAAGPAMAQAACRAGALGSLACGGLEPEEILRQGGALRAAVDGPFALNLFVVEEPDPPPESVAAAIRRLAPAYAALGLEPPERPNRFAPDFDRQFDALLSVAPPVASFTFGCLPAERVRALQARGVLVVGTATTPDEARAWIEAGADAICAQGAEAGGHRGSFLPGADAAMLGLGALLPLVRAAVDAPIIAAGGIMDGRGIAAALAQGAVAAQMGSAFLRAPEAQTAAPWRTALAEAPEDATRVTRAFSGRSARGIENGFMRAFSDGEARAPDYPVQNRLTQDLRRRAAEVGDADHMSLWAGQGFRLARSEPAETLIARWWAEARAAAAEASARLSASD